MEILKNKGEIYVVTAPCGKQYIGQAKCTTCVKGRYYHSGAKKRWHNHQLSALSNKREGCRKLNAYIRKYGAKNFTFDTLLTCDVKYLNFFENMMINEYKSLYPNGLNLKVGGDVVVFSEETRQKMSRSAKGRTFTPETIEKIRNGNIGKIVSEETREKLRINCPHPQLPEARMKISKFQESYLQPKRKYFGLPDYIYRINYSNKQGYVVKNNPNIPVRYFVASSISMDEKLELAKTYLNQ